MNENKLFRIIGALIFVNAAWRIIVLGIIALILQHFHII